MIDNDIIRAIVVALALVGSFYFGMRYERDRLLHELKDALNRTRSFLANQTQIIRAGDVVIIDPQTGIVSAYRDYNGDN
jgi:preprotein translocase subunit SecA